MVSCVLKDVKSPIKLIISNKISVILIDINDLGKTYVNIPFIGSKKSPK